MDFWRRAKKKKNLFESCITSSVMDSLSFVTMATVSHMAKKYILCFHVVISVRHYCLPCWGELEVRVWGAAARANSESESSCVSSGCTDSSITTPSSNQLLLHYYLASKKQKKKPFPRRSCAYVCSSTFCATIHWISAFYCDNVSHTQWTRHTTAVNSHAQWDW